MLRDVEGIGDATAGLRLALTCWKSVYPCARVSSSERVPGSLLVPCWRQLSRGRGRGWGGGGERVEMEED